VRDFEGKKLKRKKKKKNRTAKGNLLRGQRDTRGQKKDRFLGKRKRKMTRGERPKFRKG